MLRDNTMGDGSELSINYAFATEELADEYVSGEMSLVDAYNNGLIDETGYEYPGLRDGYRGEIWAAESVDREIESAEKDLSISTYRCSKYGNKQNILNQAAKANLKNSVPTCNCCGTSMESRTGKFGKFYYCPNSCPEQKTVSDKYWQSVRVK